MASAAPPDRRSADLHQNGEGFLKPDRNRADKAKEEGKPISRFVTASLKVDYLAPTPINTELEVRGKVIEIKGRKVIVEVSVSANGKQCATGSTVMVQIKDQN